MTTPVIIGCSAPSRRSSYDVSDSHYEARPVSGRDSLGAGDSELEKLRRERISSLFLIERYKLYITYAVVFGLSGIVFAVCMGAWKIMEREPSLREMRSRMLETPEEGPRICSSAYPSLHERDKPETLVGKDFISAHSLRLDA
ncbi:putative serine carboxypeptidase CPVL [Caligus rogercresseyi]|uniref:Putative serine carboxypeptidase CPVL n=1 Tax=Caligus rogercresseyi TaxID=217165 RepID=A0A7T8QTW6_CALRO|nr:putative serine carboxypeptidase CPVL [Caligus rogercresseyi]